MPALRSLDAVCGKCGVAFDMAPTEGAGASPIAGILGDAARCENQPWQRCPHLLAIMAGYIGRDMLDEQT
jgi:hypothetical protein